MKGKTEMEKLLALIKAKKDHIAQLQERSKACNDVNELRSINTEIDSINKEIESLNSFRASIETPDQRTAAANAVTEQRDDAAKFNPATGFHTVEKPDAKKDAAEDRAAQNAKDLKEGRSVTVASSNIILPTYDGQNINPAFKQVSDILNQADVLSLPGGEAYRVPYEIENPDAGYTGEGENAATAETKFGYANIAKSKITAYAEITEEIEKLPAIDYERVVEDGVRKSLMKKVAKEIVAGDGEANHLTGILSAKATAIDASTDLSIKAIDNTTLDEIVFSYGGDEGVEANAVLILNKKTLKAFAALRSSDGKRLHNIVIDRSGGTGTIDTIPFVINSVLPAFADADAGAYVMAYGSLANYRFTDFSPLTISKSTDYKFKEGMIAFKGVIYAGGNVAAHNGFIRVKKAATI